ncbi:MAG: diacylglycerol kinase family lipid kinase [Oscillospiraceae bacterium]|nr:diacylglycerol kinase family lipid kinase [Oscillospiraceae bacterium]
MPHFVFIINPVAGKGLHTEQLTENVRTFFEKNGGSFEIHFTTGKGDALTFVRDYLPSGETCFVACGGDGTLHEVINGAVGKADCSVGVIPCGSGNDYVKNFGGASVFSDLQQLVGGHRQPVDLLRCNGIYAVNLCNIGFDAKVAHNMSKFKRLPFVSGSLAYHLAVVFSLLSRMNQTMVIDDGQDNVIREKMILAVMANGFCYGGGYRPVPHACVADGVMEFLGVRALSRLELAKFIAIYKRGAHFETEALKPKILYRECPSVTIRGEKPLVVCLDGEVFLKEQVTVEIVPAAIDLWLPETAAPIHLPQKLQTV